MIIARVITWFVLVGLCAASFPKILWIYWDSGVSQGELNYFFIKNKQKFLPDWEIRAIDRQSAFKWLEPISSFFSFPHHIIFFKYWPFPMFRADYIRICLLQYYGGVWTDWHLILLQNFDWLDNLNSNPDVLNKYGQQPDIFMFNLDYYGSKQWYKDPETGQDFLLSPGYEIGFVATKPHTQFLSRWLKKYTEVIEGNNFFNFNLPNFRAEIDKNNYNVGGLYWKINYLFCMISIQMVIQQKQKQLDAQNWAVRKLAVKQYKIWSMYSDSTLLKMEVSANWDRQQYYRMLTQQSISNLVQKNVLPRYGIQVGGRTIQMMFGSVSNPKSIFYNIFLPIYLPGAAQNILACPTKFYIQQDSVLNKYVFQPANFSSQIIKEKLEISSCSPQKVQFYKIVINLVKFFQLITLLYLAYRLIKICFIGIKILKHNIKNYQIYQTENSFISQQEVNLHREQTFKQNLQIEEIEFQTKIQNNLQP